MTNKGIPLPTALAALKLGKVCGLTTIFNPAPRVAELDWEFYTNTDTFVLNMEEAATLTHTNVSNQDEVLEACLWFHECGVRCVVITMGKDGALGSVKDLQNDGQTEGKVSTFL